MKNIIFIVTTICFLFPFTESATAQWAIGASYEVRNEDPTNGFGLRVERGILNAIPVVDFDMRAHFSFFNEASSATTDGVSFDREIQAYDFGLALTAGIKIALIKPYVGFGIGSETFDFDAGGNNQSFNESNFYWNGFGGAELRLLPLLNPFIEYRITRLTGTDQISFDNVGRFAVGINLRF